MSAWPYPRYVAHRGAGKLAPENTLAAMRVGFDHGYRMVEFDVKLSSDDVAFLLHDDTLERTTSGRGPAGALSWKELAQIDAGSWHSSTFAGERIPTFAAIARWAVANHVDCDVEIKPMPGRERETGAAVALLARSLWQAAAMAPLLSSFSPESLEAARASAPELRRLLLVERIPPDWKAQLDRLECVALGTQFRQLTADLVSKMHDAGFKVLVYTPNELPLVAQMHAWGVDLIVTDAVDVVKPQ